MCRNIKQLRQPEHSPTEEEIYQAALQYVRKVSGYRRPSKANQAAFEQAVQGVAQATRELLVKLGAVSPSPLPLSNSWRGEGALRSLQRG